MDAIFEVIETNYPAIILVLLAVLALAIVIMLFNIWQMRRVLKKYRMLTRGVKGNNLEEMLIAHAAAVEETLNKFQALEEKYHTTSLMAEKAIQNVGMVRFNAFDDTGSDLSFAVALLNHQGDGLVITSLFGRHETRTYAKPITNGKSSYHLSSEEEEAISMAMRQAGK